MASSRNLQLSTPRPIFWHPQARAGRDGGSGESVVRMDVLLVRPPVVAVLGGHPGAEPRSRSLRAPAAASRKKPATVAGRSAWLRAARNRKISSAGRQPERDKSSHCRRQAKRRVQQGPLSSLELHLRRTVRLPTSRQCQHSADRWMRSRNQSRHPLALTVSCSSTPARREGVSFRPSSTIGWLGKRSGAACTPTIGSAPASPGQRLVDGVLMASAICR